MGTQENLDLVRRGYAAFSAGDMDTLRQLIAPDAVQRVPGSSPISGDHKGIDSILAFYGELFALSNGTMKVELEDVLSNGGDQVIAVHRATAERNGRTLDAREALRFTIHSGVVVELEDHFPDIAAQDAFWS